MSRTCTVAELADELHMSRDWVYEHREALGGKKMGPSRTAPIRFDREKAIAAAWRLGDAPAPEPARRARAGRRRLTEDVPPIRPRGGVRAP